MNRLNNKEKKGSENQSKSFKNYPEELKKNERVEEHLNPVTTLAVCLFIPQGKESREKGRKLI